MDLAAAVEFDRAAAHRNIQSVRPGMAVFEVSVKSGAGLGDLIGWVETQAGVQLSSGNGRSSTA
jgi:hydrogenase nickel incorporation protein HypB